MNLFRERRSGEPATTLNRRPPSELEGGEVAERSVFGEVSHRNDIPEEEEMGDNAAYLEISVGID